MKHHRFRTQRREWRDAALLQASGGWRPSVGDALLFAAVLAGMYMI